MQKKKSFLIITFARNEEETISEIMTKSLNYGNVLVINDSSTDNTLNLIKKFDVKVKTIELDFSSITLPIICPF